MIWLITRIDVFHVLFSHHNWFIIGFVSSYDVVFDEKKSSALSYTSRPYSEAMVMRPAVTYAPYAASSKEKTGDKITFAQFEEGYLLTETRNDKESGDEYDSESIMMSKQQWRKFF